MAQKTGFDQFADAQRDGNYPNYTEPGIEFLPSYKMELNKLKYKEKKNQAPSYCDRVLFKNNSSLEVIEDFYTCLHNVFGSDHRPVQRALTIKNFKQPDFADVQKLLDMNCTIQGYGQFDILIVNVTKLDLIKIGKLTKFDFSDVTKPL